MGNLFQCKDDTTGEWAKNMCILAMNCYMGNGFLYGQWIPIWATNFVYIGNKLYRYRQLFPVKGRHERRMGNKYAVFLKYISATLYFHKLAMNLYIYEQLVPDDTSGEWATNMYMHMYKYWQWICIDDGNYFQCKDDTTGEWATNLHNSATNCIYINNYFSAKTTRAEIGQQILPARWRWPLRPTASSGFTLRAATSSHSSKHSLHKNPSRVLLSDPLKDTYPPPPPPPQLFLFLPLPVLHHASNVVRWQHSKNLHLIISNIPLDHFPSLT